MTASPLAVVFLTVLDALIVGYDGLLIANFLS
jgi:hypothetical protein